MPHTPPRRTGRAQIVGDVAVSNRQGMLTGESDEWQAARQKGCGPTVIVVAAGASAPIVEIDS